jgi:hypothetical protein
LRSEVERARREPRGPPPGLAAISELDLDRRAPRSDPSAMTKLASLLAIAAASCAADATDPPSAVATATAVEAEHDARPIALPPAASSLYAASTVLRCTPSERASVRLPGSRCPGVNRPPAMSSVIARNVVANVTSEHEVERTRYDPSPA